MKSVRERLVHLHHCRGIGWKSIFYLLKHDKTLLSIYDLTPKTIKKLLPIPEKQLNLFINDLHSIKIQSMLKKYNENNIHVMTIFDKQYPSLLKQIYDPPWVIYGKGNLKLLEEKKMISVVGTRKPSIYGLKSMNEILLPIIKNKWVIVSGLANGVDARAHQLAVSFNGKTIAVLPGGFNFIYPKNNQVLAEKIMKHHLLISEYPPDHRVEKWQFPLRNRLISGLSLGTIIIEAKERSGSLITADQALEQGREVFAVPGSIFEDTNRGTNRLIQQGAKLVLNSDDIFEEFCYVNHQV